MSNHNAPKVDAVSWLVFLASAVALLGAVFVLVSSLINTIKSNTTKGEVGSTSLVSSASDNLKPIGSSSTSDTPVVTAAPTSARSGKEVYNAVCAACHATGVAESPLFGNKAAWEPRVATGLDAMMSTAINGKGAMPARAGQNIGDAELKAAILYMTKEAGFDLGDAATEKSAPAEEKPVAKEEPKVEAVAEKKEEVKEPSAPAAPNEPAAPVMAAAATTAVAVATAEDKPAASSANGAAVYTAKGCAACHGADGKTPIMPLYPKIAGQGKVYVTTQLTDIKSGKRNNGQSIVMKGIMAGVSEEEIAILAEYLSGL